MSVINPGDIVLDDFRSVRDGEGSGIDGQNTLRLMQWNIERGYELEKVIDHLKASKADIIALQEVDVGCKRSKKFDTGREIARALRMNYAFVCEFEELESPLRSSHTQGGGFHGNAILAKWDFISTKAIEHRHHPVDWENPDHALAKKEPRKGRRLSLEAIVDTPQGPLVCYSCHLEVFCGTLARISQLADVFRASKQRIAEGIHHLAILGDLNTMGHGIARLSPNFCCDKMRLRNLGRTEAEFWVEKVLNQKDLAYDIANDGKLHRADTGAVNDYLRGLGLDDDVCRDIMNPGFIDPFDPSTITLDNKDYRILGWSLMAGKLDWLLLRRCTALHTAVGNDDYSASDHKWMLADITLV